MEKGEILMSGGSYDYICWKDAEELMGKIDVIEQMADDLDALGYASDAAEETYLIARDLRRIWMRLNAILKGRQGLQNVWHAKEWWRGGDSLEDRLKEALLEYRGDSDD